MLMLFPNGCVSEKHPQFQRRGLAGMLRWIRSGETWRTTPWNVRSDRAANKHTATPTTSTDPGDRLRFFQEQVYNITNGGELLHRRGGIVALTQKRKYKGPGYWG